MEKRVEENKISLIENAKEVGLITFPFISDTVVDINHTYVDSDYRGRGIASMLMNAVVEQLEQRDLKCIPTCSYAINWFCNHPEKQNLLYEKTTCSM